MRKGVYATMGAAAMAVAALHGPFAGVSSAQPYPPSATATCRLTATVTVPGGDLGLSCAGMVGSATVFVDLFSEPKRLGRFSTDAQGNLNAVVEIPTSTPPGEHRLQVTAVSAQGRQEESVMIMVAAPGGTTGSGSDRGNLSRTGSSATAPLTAAGVGLLGIGAAGVIVTRRRRRSAEALDA